MRKHQIENISWQEVLWQRPYDLEAVQNILAQLANLTPRGAVIWEIRGRNGQVSHLLGADKQYIGKIEEVFRAHGDVKFHTLPRAARLPVGMAKQLRITHPQLSLKTDIAEAVIRAGLAAMTEDRDGTELVLQVILGMAYPPAPIPASLPDPHATWLEVLIGDVHQATAESRKAVREEGGAVQLPSRDPHRRIWCQRPLASAQHPLRAQGAGVRRCAYLYRHRKPGAPYSRPRPVAFPAETVGEGALQLPAPAHRRGGAARHTGAASQAHPAAAVVPKPQGRKQSRTVFCPEHGPAYSKAPEHLPNGQP